ncbi:MAG: cadherin-like domain-containing protein [Saprospiraceae bacterium]|nr:cadherin-like domain-containing protein [Saprospiraceae bacterium]
MPYNEPPLAIDDVNSGVINNTVSGNVLVNDSDPNGNTITASLVTSPAVGSVILTGNGTYTYTPPTGFVGNIVFTYQVCDNGVPGPLCDTANVFISIIDPALGNDAPVAANDQGVTLTDVPVSGNLLNNDYDPDGDNLTVNTTPVTTPTNG